MKRTILIIAFALLAAIASALLLTGCGNGGIAGVYRNDHVMLTLAKDKTMRIRDDSGVVLGSYYEENNQLIVTMNDSSRAIPFSFRDGTLILDIDDQMVSNLTAYVPYNSSILDDCRIKILRSLAESNTLQRCGEAPQTTGLSSFSANALPGEYEYRWTNAFAPHLLAFTSDGKMIYAKSIYAFISSNYSINAYYELDGNRLLLSDMDFGIELIGDELILYNANFGNVFKRVSSAAPEETASETVNDAQSSDIWCRTSVRYEDSEENKHLESSPTYDRLGRISEEAHGDVHRNYYGYDAEDRLAFRVDIQPTYGENEYIYVSYFYYYDTEGRLIEKSSISNGAGVGCGDDYYSYDADGRLISQKDGWLEIVTQYDYDANGKLVSQTAPDFYGDGSKMITTPLDTDAASHIVFLSQNGTTDDSIDKYGRTISEPNKRNCKYDAYGNMTEEIHKYNDGTSARTIMEYERLQDLIAAGKTVEPEPFPFPNRTLRIGSDGEDVKWIQAALKEMKYDETETDGQYSRDTENAVLRFQKDHEIEQTGVVDRYTAQRIAVARAIWRQDPAGKEQN